MFRRHKLVKLMIFSMFLVLAAAPLNCAKGADKAGKKYAAAGKVVDSAKSKAPEKKQQPDPASELGVLTLGMQAPDFKLQGLDGKTSTAADYRGRTVVLAFWDMTCPKEYCADQIRNLEDELKKRKLDVALLPVTRNDSKEKNAQAAGELKKNGIESGAMFDVGNVSGRAYQLRAFPLFVLIDPDGKLRAAGSMFIKQKMQTMNFIDMVIAAAKGMEVPRCEFAHFAPPEDYKKMIGTEAPNFRLLDLDGADVFSLQGGASPTRVFQRDEGGGARRQDYQPCRASREGRKRYDAVPGDDQTDIAGAEDNVPGCA